MGEGKEEAAWMEDEDQWGGILANVERGPIKVKAKGNMNDLVLKHTWGHAYGKKTHIIDTAAL